MFLYTSNDYNDITPLGHTEKSVQYQMDVGKSCDDIWVQFITVTAS